MGAENLEIIIDILVCGGYEMIPPEGQVSNSLENYLQARQIKRHYGGFNSIESELRAAPEATVRYFFNFSLFTSECTKNLLDFNGDATWCL